MKLTYIANIRLPTERAHGIQIMSMAEAFAKTGADVTLLVSKRKTSITEDPFVFYGIKKIFKLDRLSAIDFTHYGNILRAGAYHLERITFALSALRYARKNPADLFYTRDELTFVWLAKNNLPTVYEMHTKPRNIVRYKTAFKKCIAIVTISTGLKDALIQAGVPAEKIIVAHDGVDIEKFAVDTSQREARKRYDLPENAFIALYAGLLDEWKGYVTLLESTDELAKNNVQVVIVGGTETEVTTLKKKYPKALFLGFKKYEEIPVLQRAANVIVIPNSARFDISRLYTSPLKLFQAMASRIPIVASDIPSLKEIISKDTAVLFQPDTPTALAEAIIFLKNNPEKASIIADAALKEVQQYSWVNRARSLLKYLHVH